MITPLILTFAAQKGFDPSKLGLRNPTAVIRHHREGQRTEAEKKKATKPVEFRPPNIHVQAKPNHVWNRLTAKVQISPESNMYRGDLPSVQWEWYVEVKGKAVALAGGTAHPTVGGSVELPGLNDRPSFVHWHLNPKLSSDWKILEETQYTSLPKVAPHATGPNGMRTWYAPDKVILCRKVIDVELAGVPPQASVSYGETKLPTSSEEETKVRLQIPREYSGKDASLFVDDVSPKVHRVAVVPLADIFGLATPYQVYRFTIQDYMWQLDGIPSVEAPGLNVFDHVETTSVNVADLPSTKDLVNELGQPSSKKKDLSLKNFGHWDGSDWWVYAAKGIEFKVRTLRQKDGQPREIIEKVALDSPLSGQVAGIKVGDPERLVTETLGKGDVRGLFLREDIGFRSYLGGGVAFLTDVTTGNVARIEIRRPLSYLRAGILPGKLQVGDFARVADIDYETAEVTLEIPEQAKVVKGSRFILRNLDADAFADKPEAGQIIAEANLVKDGFVTCRLCRLSNNGTKPLDVEVAKKLIWQLLDPGCGFSYGIQLPQ